MSQELNDYEMMERIFLSKVVNIISPDGFSKFDIKPSDIRQLFDLAWETIAEYGKEKGVDDD